MLGQANTFPNQVVKYRGIRPAIIEEPKIAIPHIISQDKDYIWMSCHRAFSMQSYGLVVKIR